MEPKYLMIIMGLMIPFLILQIIVVNLISFVSYIGFWGCYMIIISCYGVIIGLYKFQDLIEYIQEEKGNYEYINNIEMLLVIINTCCYSTYKSIILPFDICYNIISYYLFHE